MRPRGFQTSRMVPVRSGLESQPMSATSGLRAPGSEPGSHAVSHLKTPEASPGARNWPLSCTDAVGVAGLNHGLFVPNCVQVGR